MSSQYPPGMTSIPGAALPSHKEALEAFDPPNPAYFAERPTRADFMDELRRAERPFMLYRYGETWYRMELGGQDYWFPPDDGGKLVRSPVHADPQTGRPLVVEADGIVIDMSGNRGIRTRYGMLRDIKNRMRPLGIGPLPGEGHTDLVILAVENHGHYGVVWLPGGETDEKRKAASKQLYFRTIKTWAEEQDASRQQFLKNWHNYSGNKGRIPPPPNARQRKAVDILDKIRSQVRGGAEWICPHGCSEWVDFGPYQNHMQVAHGQRVFDPKQDAAGAELRPTGIPELRDLPEEDQKAPTMIEPNPAVRAAADPMARMATQAPVESKLDKRTKAYKEAQKK